MIMVIASNGYPKTKKMFIKFWNSTVKYLSDFNSSIRKATD